jgi:UDP-N-acetylmuramoyl-tripeptide--D-alanyl-D-alanine ligase
VTIVVPTSVAELAAVVAGTLDEISDPSVRITGKAEFDSRRVQPGDLFVAFVGERADGHDYVAAARAAGAIAVLSTRRVSGGSILVADALQAMSVLATATVRRLSATVIAVTGSAGKTSTKDLIAQLLERSGPTVAPPESFNNELGYPYTVLLADEGTAFLVLEASARGIGHIRHLTEIAGPRIGVVLNVGTAHLGEFGSVAAIAQAKGELVEALPAAASGGIAILNADDSAVSAMRARTNARVFTFGVVAAAVDGEASGRAVVNRLVPDVSADQVSVDDAGRAHFTLCYLENREQVDLQLVGRHHVANALAAAAVAISCGMDVAEVAAGLSVATTRSHWRMEVSRTADDVTVVNDAYNANPESMKAALRTVAELGRRGRSVAVLGAMAELGPTSADQHRAVGRFADEVHIDMVIGVGEPARDIVASARAGSAGISAEWVSDVAAATRRLDEVLEPGDVVLVKGSRSAGMERVAAHVLGRRHGWGDA